MAFEHKENTGTLFKNDKWVKGGKFPIATGMANVNGKLMRVSAWHNDAADGKSERWSLKFEEPRPATQPTGESRPTTQCAQTTGTPREPSPMPDFGELDEIPF